MKDNIIRKNIVITGGNKGIGYQVVKQLYNEGHNIIFGSRNISLNQSAITNIINSSRITNINSSNNQHINLSSNQTATISLAKSSILKSYPLDLSSKQSIQQFVLFIKQSFTSIDILINNAGILSSKLQIIQQINTQKTLTVNYYSHFYLTYLLFNLIKNSNHSRIINTISNDYQFVNQFFLNDLKCQTKLFEPYKQLFISKFMLATFTLKLNQLFIQNNINNVKIFSAIPGTVMTQFGSQDCLTNLYKLICCCCYKTPYQGARPIIYLATQDKNKLKSGQIYDSDIQIKQIDMRARKQQIIEQIWKKSLQTYKLNQFL